MQCALNFQLSAGARLAQSVERKALNLVVAGSSPSMHPLKTAGTAEVELPGGFLIRMRPGQTFGKDFKEKFRKAEWRSG